MQRRILLLFKEETLQVKVNVKTLVGDKAYITGLSDTMALDQTGYTIMARLSVILLCHSEQHYMLISASSSAQVFLHAVGNSVKNIL